MAKRLPHQNPDPDGFDFDEDTPLEVVRREFAKRLQKAMAERGFNQSELAREASKHMPGGKEIGRDLISHYVRAIATPRDSTRLKAVARALGVEPTSLIPRRHFPSVESSAPPLDVKDVGDGKAWLRVNQRVDWIVALEILQLLKGQEDVSDDETEGA